MPFNRIRRLFTLLTPSRASSLVASPAPREKTMSAFDFDPMWHGDHWQNLLSSPMDARRYVMEDWSVSADIDWNTTNGAAPAR